MGVKQIIAIRRDLKMRRGKEIAQGAHASGLWLTKRVTDWVIPPFKSWELEWMQGSYKKVVVQVDSYEEIFALYEAAIKAGIETHMVTDLGLTEFAGVPTVTAVALGPALDERLDPFTGGLNLY